MTAIVEDKHFIDVPLSAWGHLRPHLHMVLNLLEMHKGLHVTILLSPSSIPRVEHELGSPALSHLYKSTTVSNGEKVDSVVDRLQILQCSSHPIPKGAKIAYGLEEVAKEAVDFAQTLPAFIHALITCDSTTLKASDNPQTSKFSHIKPSFVIQDGVTPYVVDVVVDVCNKLSMPRLPIIMFLPFNATSTYHHFAPEEEGGTLSTMTNAAEKLIAEGKDPNPAYEEFLYSGTGKVVTLPGLKPKFDYEWYPLMGTIPSIVSAFGEFRKGYKKYIGTETAAVILPCAQEVEPEATAKLAQLLGKPLLMVGPQFPDSVWKGEHPEEATAPNADDQRVLGFLDRMKAKHGVKSVCYSSFGSLFYPMLRPELIVFLLNSLHKAGIPILFAHASAMAAGLPEGLTQGFAEHEDVCVIKFAPQWQVLHHQATSFFVSHCGSNGSSEAIIAEVPIVSMPVCVDQGEYAALWSEKYKVGIDLVQVKTFKNTTFKKLYDGTTIKGDEESITAEMNETWKRIKGPEGEILRENMRKLKQIHKDSWEKGEARKAMQSISRWF